MNDLLFFSVYFSPRDPAGMQRLGNRLAQRHLMPLDRLIGIIGDKACGKSSFTRGMFPGVELMDETEGYDPTVVSGLELSKSLFYNKQTYHAVVSEELTESQLEEFAQCVFNLLDNDKRVIVENFERLYPYLKLNAQLLIGIGGEIIATRPNVFGPEPEMVAKNVYRTLKNRRLAYGAQLLTQKVITRMLPDGVSFDQGNIKQGFVLEFEKKPDINIDEVERQVNQMIAENAEIAGSVAETGMRMYCERAGEIGSCSLIKELSQNPINMRYQLIGSVGGETVMPAKYLNSIISP